MENDPEKTHGNKSYNGFAQATGIFLVIFFIDFQVTHEKFCFEYVQHLENILLNRVSDL